MLASYARQDYANLPGRLPLAGDERLVDAGGGVGVLAQPLRARWPDLDLVLLDRPEVLALVDTETLKHVRVHAANLLEPWGLRADAVLLARVLHDWPDDAALTILQRSREALPVGGRLFIVEMLLAEQALDGGLCDLHLLAVTGGRERSRVDLGALLHKSGFDLLDVIDLSEIPSLLIAEAQ